MLTEFLLIFGGASIAFVAINAFFLWRSAQRIDHLSRNPHERR